MLFVFVCVYYSYYVIVSVLLRNDLNNKIMCIVNHYYGFYIRISLLYKNNIGTQ